ncbi:MAG: glycosyltransferase family 2 protein [Melioribacteraceae bacterium]|nr:glycosyltransferase family 2 protein [Melioribacteraceae bacterium]
MEYVLISIIAIPVIAALVLVVYNYLTAPVLINEVHDLEYTPLVSILVKSRNNEKSIGGFIESVINQNYNNYELLILDDNSKDGTHDIIKKYEQKTDKIKLIEGKSLPKEWNRKNWIRHQLVSIAAGDILMFADPDIRIGDNAINSSLYHMQKHNPGLMTVFPNHDMNAFGDYILYPIISWILFTFIPLNRMGVCTKINFVNDKLILIAGKVLEQTGGYEKFKSHHMAEIEIFKAMKTQDIKLQILLSFNTFRLIHTKNFDESYDEISDEIYSALDFNRNRIIGITILALVFFILPVLLSLFSLKYISLVFLILFMRILISIKMHEKMYVVFLHPLHLIFFAVIGFSIINYTNKTY